MKTGMTVKQLADALESALQEGVDQDQVIQVGTEIDGHRTDGNRVLEGAAVVNGVFLVYREVG
jgi:hypothetical protein